MKINRLVIENFKSIERIELIEPNPFTVFVGPNGSGKSNIFEALEFVNRCSKTSIFEAYRTFGGSRYIRNRTHNHKNEFFLQAKFGAFPGKTELSFEFGQSEPIQHRAIENVPDSGRYQGIFTLHVPDESEQFYKGFSRLFVKKIPLSDKAIPNRTYYPDDASLNFATTNLEQVLRRVLTNPVLRDEIFEWLELFVPGFKTVEVDDRDELHWFENSSSDYFTKDLISDGTYNILALLTAVYQTDDKPQFLCIEEPENGLHPQVARELVDFFRIMCEERGHYIWLNTHSQSMVSRVQPHELVIVEKKEGATQVRQFKKEDFYGMRVDDAWLTNSLGGGLAW